MRDEPYALTCDSPHAHCVCVVGKNYRLQNIQLSKITPGEISPRGFLPAIAGRYLPRTPLAPSLAGPQSPAPLVRLFCRPTRSHQVTSSQLVVREPGPLSPGELRGLNGLAKQSGEYRARTGDLLVANQALSQLS